MLIERWMDKELEYIYTGILFRHKKEWNNAICSNIQGPREHHLLSEVSQRDKDKIIWYCFYVESKKSGKMNLYTKQRLTHRHTTQTYG